MPSFFTCSLSSLTAFSAEQLTTYDSDQTEGQITRLKLLKRSMYGRAKFDVLRQCVLHRAEDNQSETSETLAFFAEGWHTYQRHLSRALAPLTPEQLALRAAPHLRSIEELARHIIAVQAGWFHFQLEEGGKELRAFTTWGEPESPQRSAEELVSGLEHTWQVIQEVLGRYTLADLQSTVQDEWDGQIYTLTCGWVIWHVMQHDLHHGGELAYSLGIRGLTAPSDIDLHEG